MRAVFLDLNGTLVVPVRVRHPREYTIIPGAIEAVRLLNDHGFVCPVVTVQSRIAKALYSAEAFLSWFHELQEHLREHGAVVLGPYLCPHRGADGCSCKKPRADLYQQAAADYYIDIPQSFVVGDTLDDLRAAQTLGCAGCLVRTGWGEQTYIERNGDGLATYVATDILDAARWIARLSPASQELTAGVSSS
jgi:D-glycero-D-manno-heptose 1,7-bisphosphate phosphatase